MTFTVKNQDWYSETISFDDAIDQVCDDRRAREDFLLPIKDVRFGLNSKQDYFSFTIDGRDYEPTWHCLKQFASITRVPRSALTAYTSDVYKTNGELLYKRDYIDLQTVINLFSNGLRDGRVDPDKKFRFRTYDDGTMRAVLSEKYAILDNVWYLEQIKDIFGKLGHDEPRFVHWRGDADTLYGNMLLPDTVFQASDSDYGGMISVSNCEIGTRRLSLTPSIFRSICTNGCVFGQHRGNSVNQVHRGNIDLGLLKSKIVKDIDEIIPILNNSGIRLLDKNSQNYKLDTAASRLIAQVSKDQKLSQKQTIQVLEEYANHEKGFGNLFGIINAVTRAAQVDTPEEHVRLEGIGGVLMNHDVNRWNKLNLRAQNMEENEYHKILGIAN